MSQWERFCFGIVGTERHHRHNVNMCTSTLSPKAPCLWQCLCARCLGLFVGHSFRIQSFAFGRNPITYSNVSKEHNYK